MKKHSIVIVALTALFALMPFTHGRAQHVAIKTNALMWMAATPNFSCEFVTGEHASVDVSLLGHYKPYGLDSKLAGLQPEFRYWFNGRPMTREFIGVAALLATYDMTWNKNVFDGDAAGIGVTFGYNFALKKRFNIEVFGGFGAVYFQQKQYNVNDNYDDFFPDGSKRTNANGYKLLPIKLGVSISYVIK